MANDTRSGRKIKDDGNSISKGRHTGGNGVTSSSTESPDTSNLRRSSRETSSSMKNMISESSSSKKNTTSETPPLKTNVTPSPSSIRKSERIEKRTSTTAPVKRKSERLEKQSEPIPLRRSERGKGPSSSSSSGSKKSDKSLVSSELKQKKEKKEKSVKQLTMETKEVSCESKKQDADRVQVQKRRINAHSYRALLKRNKKYIAKDHNKELNKIEKSSQEYSSNCEDGSSEQVNEVRGTSSDAEQAQVECSTEENFLSPETLEYTTESRTVDDDIGLKRGQNVMHLKRKRNEVDMVSDSSAVVASKETCVSQADVNPLSPARSTGICGDKKQRADVDSTKQEILFSLPTSREKLDGELCDASIAKTTEYHNMPSLHESRGDVHRRDDLMVDANDNLGSLKEKTSKYVAYGGKLDSSRFVEYWIPVQISNVQLEQYCGTLLSKSLSLCSPLKNDPVGVLHDILISARKCCDHPYLVDKSLQSLLVKDLELAEYLDVGVKASGKLQLLDTMLSELKNQGSRVIILFQSIGGGSLGDILDDFVRQRFGSDSYERVDGNVLDSKKKAALQNFNNGSGRFVFLLETRACRPSIKLSSVHAVIIFHSDWSPVNDLRALQRITLDPQLEQIKVFRLYSFCTVEEKVLILAKQDKTPDGYAQNMRPSTSHVLLMWGASYLFNRLDEFHSGKIPASSSSNVFEQSLLNDVVQEFSTILTQNGEDNDTRKFNIILKVKQSQGTYSTSFPLFGESKVEGMDEERPHIFWTNLLEGKHPCWKYYSGSSQGSRKRVQYFDDLQKKPELEIDEVAKKQRRVASNCVNQSSLKPGLEEGKTVSRDKEGTSVDSSTIHWTCASSSTLVNNFPETSRELSYSQKSLHLLLKPDMAKLCEVLKLREDVKDTVGKFLEYLMINHRVDREPPSMLQAFEISLCWTAASLRKQKIDHKESLELAKKHLHFSCKKGEADYVYSLLQCLKEVFELSMKDVSKYQSNARLSQSEIVSHRQELFKVAQKDFSRSIRGIQKKCQKQMAKLRHKQLEEKKDIDKRYEEQKAQLETKKRTEAAVIRYHCNGKMQMDKLKVLENEYAEKFKELECDRDVRLENLEALHVASMKKLSNKQTSWVEQVKSWLQIQLSNKPSSNEYGHSVECLQAVEQHNAHENQENNASNSIYISAGQNHDKLINIITLVSGEGGLESPVIQETVAGPLRPNNGGDKLDTIASAETSIAGLKERREDSNSGDNQENNEPLNPCSREQILDGAILSMPDGHIQLGVTETISSSDGAGNCLLPVHSSGGKICDEARLSPEAQVPGEVAETVSSNDDLENVPVNAPISKDQIPDGATTSMPDGEVLLRVPEAASSSNGTENFMDSPSGEEQIATIAISAVPNEEAPLRVPKNINSSHGLENAISLNPLSKEQIPDGATSCIPSAEVPLKVPESSPGEIVESGNINGDKNEAFATTSENFNHNLPLDERSLANPLPVLTQTIIEESPVPSNQALQDVYSEPTASIGVQDGDATANDIQIALQVDPPLSNPADAVASDDSSHRAAGTGPVTCADAEPIVSRVGHQPSSENCFTNQFPPLENRVQISNQALSKQLVTSSAVNPSTDVQALQGVCFEPIASTGVQDGEATASEIQTALQVEPPLPHPVDVAASSQSIHEAVGIDPVVSGTREVSGVGHQPGSQNCFVNQFAPSPIALVESQVEHSNQALSEIVTSSALNPATDASADGLRANFVDTGTAVMISGYNNRAVQNSAPVASRLPPHMISDPLQNELERLRKSADEAIRSHEENKLKLRSDCDREIEQVRRKYEIKLQEMESEFMLRKQELDANESKVLMNKIVAAAFRSKWMDMKDMKASSAGMQQEVSSSTIHQQLAFMLSWQTMQRPPVLAGSSGPPATSVQTTSTPAAIPITSPAASQHTAVPHASALFPGIPSRPPHVSSRVSPTINHQVSRGIRAPAPHLQPFRPSTSLASTSLPSSVLPTLPSNARPTSTPLLQRPLLSPLATCNTSLYNRAPGPETSGVVPSVPNPSLSAMDLLMDFVDNRSGASQILPSSLPSVSEFSSSSVPIVRPESNMQSSQANPGQMSEPVDIVCLSDDD
ncbi:hypothetical protein AB3S75_041764 [Citrus x aurantiifolia]